MSTILIREAKLEDLPDLVKLCQTKPENLNYEVNNLINVHIPEIVEGRLHAQITDNHCYVLVAEIENQIVGTAHLTKEGFLSNAYVQTPMKGVGAALLRTRVRQAKNLGIPAVFTTVPTNHKKTEQLVTTQGFRKLDDTPGYSEYMWVHKTL